MKLHGKVDTAAVLGKYSSAAATRVEHGTPKNAAVHVPGGATRLWNAGLTCNADLGLMLIPEVAALLATTGTLFVAAHSLNFAADGAKWSPPTDTTKRCKLAV